MHLAGHLDERMPLVFLPTSFLSSSSTREMGGLPKPNSSGTSRDHSPVDGACPGYLDQLCRLPLHFEPLQHPELHALYQSCCKGKFRAVNPIASLVASGNGQVQGDPVDAVKAQQASSQQDIELFLELWKNKVEPPRASSAETVDLSNKAAEQATPSTTIKMIDATARPFYPVSELLILRRRAEASKRVSYDLLPRPLPLSSAPTGRSNPASPAGHVQDRQPYCSPIGVRSSSFPYVSLIFFALQPGSARAPTIATFSSPAAFAERVLAPLGVPMGLPAVSAPPDSSFYQPNVFKTQGIQIRGRARTRRSQPRSGGGRSRAGGYAGREYAMRPAYVAQPPPALSERCSSSPEQPSTPIFRRGSGSSGAGESGAAAAGRSRSSSPVFRMPSSNRQPSVVIYDSSLSSPVSASPALHGQAVETHSSASINFGQTSRHSEAVRPETLASASITQLGVGSPSLPGKEHLQGSASTTSQGSAGSIYRPLLPEESIFNHAKAFTKAEPASPGRPGSPSRVKSLQQTSEVVGETPPLAAFILPKRLPMQIDHSDFDPCSPNKSASQDVKKGTADTVFSDLLGLDLSFSVAASRSVSGVANRLLGEICSRPDMSSAKQTRQQYDVQGDSRPNYTTEEHDEEEDTLARLSAIQQELSHSLSKDHSSAGSSAHLLKKGCEHEATSAILGTGYETSGATGGDDSISELTRKLLALCPPAEPDVVTTVAVKHDGEGDDLLLVASLRELQRALDKLDVSATSEPGFSPINADMSGAILPQELVLRSNVSHSPGRPVALRDKESNGRPTAETEAELDEILLSSNRFAPLVTTWSSDYTASPTSAEVPAADRQVEAPGEPDIAIVEDEDEELPTLSRQADQSGDIDIDIGDRVIEAGGSQPSPPFEATSTVDEVSAAAAVEAVAAPSSEVGSATHAVSTSAAPPRVLTKIKPVAQTLKDVDIYSSAPLLPSFDLPIVDMLVSKSGHHKAAAAPSKADDTDDSSPVRSREATNSTASPRPELLKRISRPPSPALTESESTSSSPRSRFSTPDPDLPPPLPTSGAGYRKSRNGSHRHDADPTCFLHDPAPAIRWGGSLMKGNNGGHHGRRMGWQTTSARAGAAAGGPKKPWRTFVDPEAATRSEALDPGRTTVFRSADGAAVGGAENAWAQTRTRRGMRSAGLRGGYHFEEPESTTGMASFEDYPAMPLAGSWNGDHGAKQETEVERFERLLGEQACAEYAEEEQEQRCAQDELDEFDAYLNEFEPVKHLNMITG